MQGDVVRMRVTGPADAVHAVRRLVGRRRGLRTSTASHGQHLELELDAAQIEALGPIIEAAAGVTGVHLRLTDIDAVVEPGALDARASGVWAAIGDTADRRAVDAEAGRPPSIPLFALVRIREEDGRRVALDGRPPRTDGTGVQPPDDLFPTKFDDASWHVDSTITGGHPRTHAWTHMALYLTWLIRHNLADEAILGPDCARVRAGGIVGAAIIERRTDGKLLSLNMTDEGTSFSSVMYERYLTAYGTVFEAEPDYGVPADEAAYARVEPLLEALWTEWSAGRR